MKDAPDTMIDVLVTGGAGFIGSNYVRHAIAAHGDWRVTTLDKLTYAGRMENLKDVLDHPRHRFVKGDIVDATVAAPLVAAADIVVHFAAETHVDRSILDAGEFITTDIQGTYVLLEAARQSTRLRRFIQISTDEVYGSVPEGRSRETDELKPRNPYSASKAGADRLAYSFWATWQVPVVISRASNNYGPNQFPEKIIPLFITNAIDDRPVPLYGDGLNVRDWLHVSDHCRAIDVLIDRGVPGEVYNVGGGNEIANRDLTERILALAGRSESLIRRVADRPGHDRRYALDSAKIGSLGWTPMRAVPRRAGVDRGLVSRERVVVATDQGARSRLPGILSGAVRHSRRRMTDSVLVTGAAGFAGSHLVDALLADGATVVGWHRPGSRPGIQPTVRWAPVDILDWDAVARGLAAAQPDVVFHCAGSAHVGSSWRDSLTPLETNVLGTHFLLDAMRRAGRPARVVVTGSALVYRVSTEALSEDAPVGPSSPYGISKLAQEMAALRAAADDGIPVVVARPFNHAGPRQDPSYVTASFARQIALAEAGRGPGVIVVGNLEARRDLTDVRDTVRAYRALAQRGVPGRVYNVCGGQAYSDPGAARASACARARPARRTSRPDAPPAQRQPDRSRRSLAHHPGDRLACDHPD